MKNVAESKRGLISQRFHLCQILSICHFYLMDPHQIQREHQTIIIDSKLRFIVSTAATVRISEYKRIL